MQAGKTVNIRFLPKCQDTGGGCETHDSWWTTVAVADTSESRFKFSLELEPAETSFVMLLLSFMDPTEKVAIF